jgi:hypothetical protein
MAKPLLLLDVDGVLAPFGGDYEDTHRRVEVHSRFGVHDVYLRHDLPEILQRLMQSFKLMWGTGWEHSANDHLLEHLGLEDPLDVLEFWGSIPGEVEEKLSGPIYLSETATWKLPWMKQFLDKDPRPAVWIDDEILDDAFIYATERTLNGKPTLFVRPDPALGFIDEHLEELEKWAGILARLEEDS